MIDVKCAEVVAVAGGARLRIVSLGDWGGRLLAEYDAAEHTINVDATALRHLQATRGDAFATRFLLAAVRHELVHRRLPGAPERAAREGCGDDARAFERALQGGAR